TGTQQLPRDGVTGGDGDPESAADQRPLSSDPFMDRVRIPPSPRQEELGGPVPADRAESPQHRSLGPQPDGRRRGHGAIVGTAGAGWKGPQREGSAMSDTTDQDVTVQGDGLAATIRTARTAADWWAGLTAAERRRRLLAFKHHLVAECEQLAQLISAEAGKPAADAMVEVMISVAHLDWAARNAARVMRRRTVNPGLLGLNQHATVGREPYGVVAVIGPWN